MTAAENDGAPNHQRRESWSRYWSLGALHSCAGSFSDNYSGEVEGFWRSATTGLARDSRLLDIATGNGALPRLLLDFFPEADVRVDAVDLADIHPQWLASVSQTWRQQLAFHPGVAAERLPFEAGSMDMVISQFGLEYTVLEQSLPEINRVLRGGGRLALVLHAADSLIVGHAREELDHIRWLRDASRLIELGDALCDPFAQAATPAGRAALAADVAANQLRAEFNQAMAEASARAKASSCPDVLLEVQRGVAEALSVSSRSGQPGDGRERLARLLLALSDNRIRLHELVACALDRAGVDTLLLQAGAALESLNQLRFNNGQLLGWGLRARIGD